MRSPSRSRRVLAALAVAAATLVTAPTAPASGATPRAASADAGPESPADYSYAQKVTPGQALPRHAYDLAAAQAAALPATPGAWRSVGPTNIGGRVVGLALDPRQRDTLYAATASGGLWRSTDAGLTFAPAWPDGLTQAMGAVAVAPDGTIYAGTGEPNPGGGSITYGGTGVYRSTDQGRTWQQIGLRDSGAIGAIVVDPRDPHRIWVAATGSLYNPGGERGVYVSANGGDTWRQALAVPTEFTGATDVQLDPNDPRRVYAVLWDHRRVPNQRTYGGVGSGVYRSTDGGRAWQRLGGGLPAAGPGVGRIGIGVAASEPGRLYAIVINTDGSFGGFYTSADAGGAWTRLPDVQSLVDSQSSYGWWFGRVWVDPRDARHLHLAGVPLMTSTDGGTTWTQEDTAVHSDQHALIWDPRDPSRVYLGDDGGVYRSDAGGDGAWVAATYQPWTQLYDVAISPQDPSRYSGGAQDNGSVRSWNGPSFNPYFDGDGEQNLINPRNDNNVFACYQYGECARSTDGGNTMVDYTAATTADRTNWYTPVQFDPVNPAILYYGGNRLNRSTDGGVTWAPISPDLTGGPGPGLDGYPFGTITTVAAGRDGHTVWVGTDDGRVWVTRDLGAHWTNLLSGQPWVTRIQVAAADAGVAYVSLSGYRSGSAQPHVLRVALGGGAGVRWTDLSGNLPQAPVNDVVPATGGTLYVSTDQGVFVSPSGGGSWSRLGGGLPLVPVNDIEYDHVNHRLVAATFGRGIYQITVP